MKTAFTFIKNSGETFNSSDYKIYMTHKPTIPLPRRKVEKFEILGADSTLTYDYETYEDRDMDLSLVAKSYEDAELLYNVFNGEMGKLYFNYLDGYYVVKGVEEPEIRDAKGIPEIDVPITLAPFFFTQEITLNITSNQTINILGNVKTKPIITIYGTGTVNFYFNSDKFEIKNLESSLTINTNTLQIYKNLENCANKVTGDISKLILKPGSFNIQKSTGISKIEIKYIKTMYR